MLGPSSTCASASQIRGVLQEYDQLLEVVDKSLGTDSDLSCSLPYLALM